MYCPTCKTINLVMSERQGVEIDYCPQCRGVWLDRGELDKIIDKSVTASPAPKAEAQMPTYQNQSGTPHHQNQPHGGHYKKKKESFLSELFDF
jgi:Zn-finger nucleic acid-binding protein